MAGRGGGARCGGQGGPHRHRRPTEGFLLLTPRHDWTTVRVRHPGGYVTGYLHLSRFATGVSAGARVGQGEVIAYVGSTGLATAAHLDYRVQRNGAWLNPMALGGVAAEPIPRADSTAFLAWRDAIRVSLSTGAPLPAPSPVRNGDQTQLAALPATAATAATAAGVAVARR